MPGGSAQRKDPAPHAGNGHVFRALVLWLMVGTVVVTIGLSYLFARQSVTDASLERREAVATVAATLLEERFNRLVDVGVSLATRVAFRGHVAAGRWDEAIRILEGVPSHFPYIDRFFLTDPDGTLMADTPRIAGAVGRDFSGHDWYRAVSETGAPYVSEVYERIVEPRYKVVAVAIPIRPDDDPNAPTFGFLVMHVRVDALLDWLREIPAGEQGTVFAVDQHGHLAAHTGRPLLEDTPDISYEPVVGAMRAGQSGVGIHEDPDLGVSHVASFAPVPGFGWGVVVEQPTQTFLAEEQRQLAGFTALIVGLLAIVLLLAVLVLRTSHRLSGQRAEVQRLHASRDADLERQVAIRTQQLQESQRKFATLVDHVPGMVYRCRNDRRWTMEFCSKGTQGLTGYGPETFTREGTAFADVILPEDRERVWQQVQEGVAARRPYVLEYRIRARDGTVKQVWEQGSAVYGPDGKAQALEGIIMDVTKERTEAREQERLNRLLIGRELRMVELKQQLTDATKKKRPQRPHP